MILMMFSAASIAQSQKKVFTSNVIGNLKMGIQSNNYGLKRDCIYFAAKYKVDEVVDELVNEFKKESDPRNRVLIALAIYKIGNRSGIEEVYQASLTDSDPKVRKRCFEIMNLLNEESLVSVH